MGRGGMMDVIDLHLFGATFTLFDSGAITEWGLLLILAAFGSAAKK